AGRLPAWADFWERLFGFRRNADGEFASPCGRIRLRIEEAADAGACHDEGIRRIALAAPDIAAVGEKTAAVGPLTIEVVQA
ncbi:MAG TPA: hypothetical protein VIH37_04670, partial [Candidatus Limnocylindrales bacterium]